MSGRFHSEIVFSLRFLCSKVWHLWTISSDHTNKSVLYDYRAGHVSPDMTTRVPTHENHVPRVTQLSPLGPVAYSLFSRPIIVEKHIPARGKLSEVSCLGCMFPDYYLVLRSRYRLSRPCIIPFLVFSFPIIKFTDSWHTGHMARVLKIWPWSTTISPQSKIPCRIWPSLAIWSTYSSPRSPPHED